MLSQVPFSTLDGDKIHNWAFATAGEDKPPPIPAQIHRPWSLPAQLRWMANPGEEDISSIVDIDIDYFTYSDNDGPFTKVFSDQYLRELGSATR